MTIRDDIVAAARSRRGVRFQEYGRNEHGLDCAGLLIVVAREVGLVPPDFDVRGYSQRPDGTLLERMAPHMGRRLNKATMRAGDAIVIITDQDPQHLGILAQYKGRDDVFSIIHASNDERYLRVIDMRLMFSKHVRFAAAYAFPGVE